MPDSSLKQALCLTSLALAFTAFHGKASTGATPVAPAPAAPAPVAAVPAPVAPPPAAAPVSYNGEWSGNSGEDAPLDLSIENNQVKSASVNLRQQKGSCSFGSGFSSDNPAPINGKSFTVKGKHDNVEFTLNGTFTSPKEASGTIDWKGKSEICGDIGGSQIKWTAKKSVDMPDSDDDK